MQNGEILSLLLRAVRRENTKCGILIGLARTQEYYKCHFSSLLCGNLSSHTKGKPRKADQLGSPPFCGGRQPDSPLSLPGRPPTARHGPARPGPAPAAHPVPVHGADGSGPLLPAAVRAALRAPPPRGAGEPPACPGPLLNTPVLYYYCYYY